MTPTNHRPDQFGRPGSAIVTGAISATPAMPDHRITLADPRRIRLGGP